ncbi:MAG: hypothetical protein [Caudoviricetes sp.]|nr:MAG: hypothetical protein [Caudoviricetes sp.]
MSNILTNSKVANTMSDLELRARQGDPWAQKELQRQSMSFAIAMTADSKSGADMKERKKLLR